jgi:hypothetical protein
MWPISIEKSFHSTLRRPRKNRNSILLTSSEASEKKFFSALVQKAKNKNEAKFKRANGKKL